MTDAGHPGTDEHRSERVASNDKVGPDDEAVEGSWSPRRSKAASTRATSRSTAGKDGSEHKPDPDELVEEIEKTREELAETLDAIADKVSPKKVANRTKQAVKDGAGEAVDSVKGTAADAAGAVKGGVAAVKEKVTGDSGSVRSPLTPATSVELDAATPVPGAEVPVEPAPTPGALADASFVAVEPAGAETAAYPSTLPPAAPSRTPMLAGAGAALVVLLLVLKRRRR